MQEMVDNLGILILCTALEPHLDLTSIDTLYLSSNHPDG